MMKKAMIIAAKKKGRGKGIESAGYRKKEDSWGIPGSD